MSADARDGADVVVALADGLRAAGVAVGTGQVVTCGQAMATIDVDDLADRYWAGRLTLVTDHRDLATYDQVFAAVADGGAPGPGEPPARSPQPPPDVARDAASDRSAGASTARDDALAAGGVASSRERLRHRRFDRATDEELAAISDTLRRLRVAVPHRTSRRTTPGRRGELDLARTLDRALASDGELIDRAWQQRRTRPRRLVLLLDVSGSMAGYARAMLRFAVAARRVGDRGAGQQVEVFAFATRLTRLTASLSSRDPDAAIAAAAAEVVDWDGGTRIGGSLDRLLRVWGRRGVLRGAVVVVCSDGLERGDPALLAASMARLHRSVHRVVWVNPLAGDPRYEPAQRGMRAALPHVDVFLPGHDLASLEDLADTLAGLR
ncbi:vWA domain-containing protein [Nitriliruptor alkaliphilus]|uniref:vWA domain-containing protein n=1 Tax=Nitriliruptor alkaliphilus TaxID=427918 RepID=UPI000697DB23|nr:VWA domain-containing protein [Nitriliruptor alkaliphilus]